jgi:hypothetical protein
MSRWRGKPVNQRDVLTTTLRHPTWAEALFVKRCGLAQDWADERINIIMGRGYVSGGVTTWEMPRYSSRPPGKFYSGLCELPLQVYIRSTRLFGFSHRRRFRVPTRIHGFIIYLFLGYPDHDLSWDHEWGKWTPKSKALAFNAIAAYLNVNSNLHNQAGQCEVQGHTISFRDRC